MAGSGTLRQLRGDLASCGRLLRETAAAVDSYERRVHQEGPREELLSALALKLHGFYSIVEDFCSRVARELNGVAVDGERSHQILVDRMAHEVPQTRPAVFRRETAQGLDALRSFRHFVVHGAYRIPLDWEKMRHHVASLPRLLELLEEDFKRFDSFLERAAAGM